MAEDAGTIRYYARKRMHREYDHSNPRLRVVLGHCAVFRQATLLIREEEMTLAIQARRQRVAAAAPSTADREEPRRSRSSSSSSSSSGSSDEGEEDLEEYDRRRPDNHSAGDLASSGLIIIQDEDLIQAERISVLDDQENDCGTMISVCSSDDAVNTFGNPVTSPPTAKPVKSRRPALNPLGSHPLPTWSPLLPSLAEAGSEIETEADGEADAAAEREAIESNLPTIYIKTTPPDKQRVKRKRQQKADPSTPSTTKNQNKIRNKTKNKSKRYSTIEQSRDKTQHEQEEENTQQQLEKTIMNMAKAIYKILASDLHT